MSDLVMTIPSGVAMPTSCAGSGSSGSEHSTGSATVTTGSGATGFGQFLPEHAVKASQSVSVSLRIPDLLGLLFDRAANGIVTLCTCLAKHLLELASSLHVDCVGRCQSD